MISPIFGNNLKVNLKPELFGGKMEYELKACLEDITLSLQKMSRLQSGPPIPADPKARKINLRMMEMLKSLDIAIKQAKLGI